jgi:peptidoglycan/xylan/chitin deacetylase (PgdA/CDA1 family)
MRLPAVLMFHHVEPKPLEPAPRFPNSYLTLDDFRAVLDLVEALGYTTLSLAEAARRVAPDSSQSKSTSIPRKSVVLTFDDGCRCFGTHAWPELKRRGMQATLFAVSGALGGTNHWDDRHGERVEHLADADELRALARDGVEIGCHSRTHRDLSVASVDEFAAEIVQSRADLEATLGCPIETYCYPYGRLSEAARNTILRAGFLAAVSIHDRPLARYGDLFAWPRLAVNPKESRFERRLKINGHYPLWSRLPRLGLLSALRRRGV